MIYHRCQKNRRKSWKQKKTTEAHERIKAKHVPPVFVYKIFFWSIANNNNNNYNNDNDADDKYYYYIKKLFLKTILYRSYIILYYIVFIYAYISEKYIIFYPSDIKLYIIIIYYILFKF